ncbi:mid1-interacting protein 1-like [Halyomorpha halys]|uniref:mid1-interacting protein 1-like n=1 Tax=Halyomorpha halys TaxID=286706 RepID=UPI0006D4F1F6|nr:mid1-interacting protein 1-B [Halyomorpha halys]
MLTHEFINTASMFSSSETFNIPMDSNRNYRRVPHQEAEFSSQSIMKAMEKFVQAVQEMDETILVPSRLMDLEVGDSEDTASLKSQSKKGSERDNLSSTDLFRLYNMVNCVKNELLWGNNKGSPDDDEMTISSTAATPKTHVRRPSIASLSSSQSLSDTDSETGNENDSGIEGESEAKPDYINKMEESFRRHLYGLHRSLNHMSAAANYLTKRYQSDIGASV